MFTTDEELRLGYKTICLILFLWKRDFTERWLISYQSEESEVLIISVDGAGSFAAGRNPQCVQRLVCAQGSRI